MITFKVFIIVFCISILNVTAQDKTNILNQNKTNFFEMRKSFYQGFNGAVDTNEGSPLNQFRKAESIWGPRLSPTGSISNAGEAIHNWTESFNLNKRNMTRLTADWKSLGPFNRPPGVAASGTGRLNCIAFDPVYPNSIMYVGSPFGGLWKTTDGGKNWFNLNTDMQLPLTKVSDIAINPSNPKMIYIATGDRDDYHFLSTSAGIYRTIDGGQQWNSVNSGLDFSGFFQISKILINPLNPDEVYAATSTGIYKTINATTSCVWSALSDTKVYQNYFRNIIFKPDNLYTTIYASGKDILKSTNGGGTWSSMTGPGTGLDYSTLTATPYPVRINIEVSPNSPNVLYASIIMSDSQGQLIWNNIRRHYLYRFDGTNWTMKNSIIYDPNNYTSYGVSESWLALAISPINSNNLFLGNVIMWRSLDGANTPLTSTFSYYSSSVHPDVHDIKYSPDGQTLYLACDGGFFKLTNPLYTTNPSAIWVDLNNGLAIGTITKIGGSQQESDLMLIGEVDCGSSLYDPANLPNNAPWKTINGGDGCEQAIDYTNSNIMFTSSQKNNISRSINRGGSWSSAYNPPGETNAEFISDYIMHPSNPNVLYCDFTNNQKLQYTLYGSNWTKSWLKVSNFHTDYFPQAITEIATSVAISETNPLYLYNAVQVIDKSWNESYHLFKSTTGGYDNGCTTNCWSELFPPNPHYITGIAVSYYDQNKIWISYSGYDLVHKVKMYNGSTWSDYSTGLPNAPVNNIIIERGTDDALYTATDVGIYFRNATMSQWEPYMNNLPNVSVSELEINYTSNKLRAGTFGRGLWESSLACITSSTPLQITTNTIWNLNMRMDRNVIVKTGKTLTINNTAKISFLDNTTIFIETGAKLIVDGATLTNGCTPQWQGIEVQSGGYLELNSTTIADYSIDVKSGGTLRIRGGLAISGNNHIDIESGGYICVDNGITINLTDPLSAINLHNGYNLGVNTAFVTNPGTCNSILTSINKIGSGFIYEFNDVFIQNESLTGNQYIPGNNISAGTNVTTSKPQGPVVIKSGANVVFDADGNILLDKGFEVELGASFEAK